MMNKLASDRNSVVRRLDKTPTQKGKVQYIGLINWLDLGLHVWGFCLTTNFRFLSLQANTSDITGYYLCCGEFEHAMFCDEDISRLYTYHSTNGIVAMCLIRYGL